MGIIFKNDIMYMDRVPNQISVSSTDTDLVVVADNAMYSVSINDLKERSDAIDENLEDIIDKLKTIVEVS